MPDPKRMARIYLSQGTVALLESDEAWQVCHHVVADETHAIPFEPAVPRCASCQNFHTDCSDEDDEPYAYCEQMVDPVPLDGSGYCHEHTEAKR